MQKLLPPTEPERTPAETDRDGAWWLEAWFPPHRNTPADVHPLLASLQTARGVPFMTPEHVVAVLDARDPAALVGQWIGDRLATTAAVPAQRRCRFPGCPRERVEGRNAKWCVHHGPTQAKVTNRRAVRSFRKRARTVRT